jgi:hypothetical protein
MSLNLAVPLRDALVASPDVQAICAAYKGEPAVFTRRPAPDDAPYPLVMVSPDISIGNADYLRTFMPVVTRDLAVYGQQPDQYREVETLAYAIREQFHQVKTAIIVPGYHVIDINCTGPIAGPADDPNIMGRIVTLSIQLQKLA